VSLLVSKGKARSLLSPGKRPENYRIISIHNDSCHSERSEESQTATIKEQLSFDDGRSLHRRATFLIPPLTQDSSSAITPSPFHQQKFFRVSELYRKQ